MEEEGHVERDAEPTLEELLAETAGRTFYVLHMDPTDKWATVGREDLRSHLLWMREQESKEVVVLAGPLDHDRHSGAGMCIIRAESREQAEAIAASDPFHQQGFRRTTVLKWTVNEGFLSLNVTLSTRRWSLA